jgi:hypothetical protein
MLPDGIIDFPVWPVTPSSHGNAVARRAVVERQMSKSSEIAVFRRIARAPGYHSSASNHVPKEPLHSLFAFDSIQHYAALGTKRSGVLRLCIASIP